MNLNKAIYRKGAVGYFASANSAHGFYSLFSDVYNENKLKSLYILKGGPGTGKSTLMDKIAAMAEKKGLDAEVYLCSSDAASLDGILIKDLGIAVIDGTAPHTQDPTFPGVCGEIVNLGESWDNVRLKEERNYLEELFSEKSENYKRAYRYLSAAGIAENDVLIGASTIVDEEKADGAVNRIVKKYAGKHGKDGVTIRRFVSGYGCGGDAFIPSLNNKAELIVKVTSEYGVDSLILDMIEKAGREKKLPMIISPDPLLPEHAESVYFTDSKVLFMKEKDTPKRENEIILNCKRFIRKEALAANRQKLRFSQKIKNTLLAEALASLSSAGKTHAEIEEIYKSAMHFDDVTVTSEKLIKRIFR